MLRERKLKPFTARELKPEGWLRRQLEIQAEGLSGHLDLIWPDVRDSKWIGGDREGWERVPYWLDGFIPLAWLLDDGELQKRAAKYIDGILAGQQEDGWICPCKEEERERYDIWAAFLICKVLTVYHDCTGDTRVEDAVYRALRQLLVHISRTTLFNWSAARWYECLIPIFWLYERKPEDWLIDLAFVLEGEGIDYEKLYANLSFDRPAIPKYWTQLNHVVNVAMALKSRAEMSRLTGEDPDEFAIRFYGKLQEKHGMATGHFTGDECLSGTSPIQGSECCSVAEAMYSYEELLSIGGNPVWGDILEKTAFNAFPATTSPDMWTHQYVQMTNQIQCARIPEEAVPFNSNNGEAHMFGLEPNFGCCTANFNQAWPKFALAVMMGYDNGIAVTVLMPAVLKTMIGGVGVTVRIMTSYPFRDGALVTVETEGPVEFELSVRIPGFAKEAFVDHKSVEAGKFARVKKVWEGKQELNVSLVFVSCLADRPGGGRTAWRGPLLFALPITEKWERLEYTRDGVERKYPYCDYLITPQSEWNYGFAEESFDVEFGEISDYPFSQTKPPVRLKTRMVKIPWSAENGICRAQPDELKALGAPEEIRLQPYGCTNLRMTEMPFIEPGQ